MRDTKVRPTVVISRNEMNEITPHVIVVPLTHDLVDRDKPYRVSIAVTPTNGLAMESLAICEAPTAVVISRLVEQPVDKVTPLELEQIRDWAARAIAR